MEQNLLEIFVEEAVGRKCGCYIRYPPAAGLKPQRALVPLRHIDYHLQIVNSLLNLTLTQTYRNPTDKFLQVEYSLPIIPECSIYKFIAEFGDVKIEGIVQEKQQAKEEFQKAKREGRHTVIGTVDPDSKNILNLKIGNIPPKTNFITTISLLQQIKISLNTFYRVQIPSAISPHYMNKTQRVVKFKQFGQHRWESRSETDYGWSFKIELKTNRKVLLFDSPSHNLTMLNQNEQGTQTLLVMAQSQIPNKDFVFTYTTEDFHLPSSILGSTDTSSTVMLSFIPKFCTLDLTDAYKASVENRSYEIDISTVRGEYVFFLDRSHSMGGKRMTKAKEALIFFLKSLPQDSYFNVISFGNTASRMFVKSEKNHSATVNEAIEQVEQMKANMGGTWIYTCLFELLSQRVIPGYPRQVFLLTDGGVENTTQVISMVWANTNYSRVHTIGIGDGASEELIMGCAEAGKGKFIMISDNQNPAQKIVQLLENSLTPFISGVKLKCSQEDQIESIIPNPKCVPYIMKDDIANFFIIFKGPLTGKKHFCFEYEDSATKQPYRSQIQIDQTAANFPFVDKMAHLKVLKCLQLSAENDVMLDCQLFYPKVHNIVKQAVQYSIKHQVLCKYTSFVCVGNQLSDHLYQEYKSVGSEKIIVEGTKPAKPAKAVKHRSKARLSKQPPKRFKKSTTLPLAYPHYLPTHQTFSAQPMLFQNNYSNLQHSSLHSTPSHNLLQYGNRISSPEINYGLEVCEADDIENQLQDDEVERASAPRKQVKMQHRKRKEPVKSIGRQKNSRQHRGREDKSGIDEIVYLQEADGSWQDAKLIEKLGKNVGFILGLLKSMKAAVVITKLVVLWLQKHHTQWHYKLIVRKAIAWLAKASISKSDQQQLDCIQCQ